MQWIGWYMKWPATMASVISNQLSSYAHQVSHNDVPYIHVANECVPYAAIDSGKYIKSWIVSPLWRHRRKIQAMHICNTYIHKLCFAIFTSQANWTECLAKVNLLHSQEMVIKFTNLFVALWAAVWSPIDKRNGGPRQSQPNETTPCG